MQSRVGVVLATGALLAALAVLGPAAAQRNVPTGCGTDRACFPWDAAGPFCGRGNRINLRFAIDLAPENYYRPDFYGFRTTTQATYAFCPVVDELQAFNLTEAAAFMALDLSKEDINATISSAVTEAFLSVPGFGEFNNVLVPQNRSFGRALIVDNRTNQCPLGQVGVARFLVLNVTMENGRFRYFPDDSTHPQGTGFMPTCDASGNCLIDSESHCIGEPGLQNCARCFADPAELREMPLQVWVSYYGTDNAGRLLRSGANNPMNFRAFSGSGVYGRITDSVDRLRAGRTAQDDQLEP